MNIVHYVTRAILAALVTYGRVCRIEYLSIESYVPHVRLIVGDDDSSDVYDEIDWLEAAVVAGQFKNKNALTWKDGELVLLLSDELKVALEKDLENLTQLDTPELKIKFLTDINTRVDGAVDSFNASVRQYVSTVLNNLNESE